MVRNFLFHRVSPQRDKLWDPMDPRLFEKCIRFIKNRYETCLIEDLVDYADLKTSNNKYATIMFDDGYKDNVEYALAILEKYNCKASFYVVTDCIEKNIPTWTQILEHSFQYTKAQKLELDFEFIPDNLKVVQLQENQEKINYVKKLKPFLKQISHRNRSLVLERIQSQFDDVELPKLMMNWDDLRNLRSAGHYIGSHSLSHSMLGTMDDLEEIESEIKGSGEVILKNLGYFPQSFSYPVGSYNSFAIEACKKAGYRIGLAVKQKLFDPSNDGLFEIPRIELYNEPWYKTRLRITNQLEVIKRLIGY